jgi:Protein of unknown function (DUF3795)
MNKVLAYCGLDCGGCGAYLATKNNDDAQRVKTAEEWSKQFGHVLKPEDINCGGCTSKDELNFQYCTLCEIRKCGQEKKMKNCAYCADYACEKLEKFFTMARAAKANLEANIKAK